eukprot:TRINITY_DN22565_c0_g1_i1.p1 TRINITY_DN22565_c0_g1~~TRINITY_DN22565_c0_g1_i1.p1  ORF type:complete len:343 (+),score=53.08 TRINITY_DN22565_c0_g1_i1:81-1109(+)
MALKRLVASALVIARLGGALDSECKNPLFQTHWFRTLGQSTAERDAQALNSMPTVKTGLTACPYYNGKASCCNKQFELAQKRFFGFFRNIVLPSKLALLAAHRLSVLDVRHRFEFEPSSFASKETLGLAIERFHDVLHPSVHGECFSKLLEYVAGMICFACRPDWPSTVSLSNRQIIRVHVTPATCLDIWTHCNAFGEASVNLRTALLDSIPAKQAKGAVVDLSMFADQQALCDWLHNTVALHPFQYPTEAELETAPEQTNLQEFAARRLTVEKNATVPFRKLFDGGDDSDIGEYEVDPLLEGQRSGFDTKWPTGESNGVPLGSDLGLGSRLEFMIVLTFLV